MSFGTPNYAQDEAVLLKTFSKLNGDQRDEVILQLPKPLPSEAEMFAEQVLYINGIASGKPFKRHLQSEDDAHEWIQEIGEDAGTTDILNTFRQMDITGDIIIGIITVTPKNALEAIPGDVPYATFEYDSHTFTQGRPTQQLTFYRNQNAVVKFKRGLGPWMVSFPASHDTDSFQVDKNICVFIVDDL